MASIWVGNWPCSGLLFQVSRSLCRFVIIQWDSRFGKQSKHLDCKQQWFLLQVSPYIMGQRKLFNFFCVLYTLRLLPPNFLGKYNGVTSERGCNPRWIAIHVSLHTLWSITSSSPWHNAISITDHRQSISIESNELIVAMSIRGQHLFNVAVVLIDDLRWP